MSPIGRVFVVVNLVLSAAFLGWAGAVLAKSDEFKTKFENEQDAHAKSRQELQDEVNRARTDRDEAQRTLGQVRSEKSSLEAERDRLQRDLDDQKSQNAQLRAAVDQINGKLGDFQQTITQLQSRTAELERDKDTLRTERENAVNAQLAAENERANAQEEQRRLEERIASLEETTTTLTKERDKLSFQLEALLERTKLSVQDLVAQPYIEGRVFEVSDDPPFVALSVGSDQEVKIGYSFEVFDGKTWKGQVVVDSVEPKFCTARIKSRNPAARIAKGDRVATRLP
jgi:predicted nuclease with TOPRIM domain